MLSGIDIYRIINRSDRPREHSSTEFDNKVIPLLQQTIIHPQHGCSKIITNTDISSGGEHASAGYVNLAIKLDRYRLTGICLINIAVSQQDPRNFSLFPARHADNLCSDGNRTLFNLSLKTAEGIVRAAHALNRHIEELILKTFSADHHILKIGQKRRSAVPRDPVGGAGDIVSLGCRQRNKINRMEI